MIAYRIDNIPVFYKEDLLKKTYLTLKENKDIMKKLKITWINSKCLFPSLLTELNYLLTAKHTRLYH